ncbi:GNAT family N-acetyltransferase [Amaricoccus solimangrovi]|uniref:GNAT family N-acetyltransferase n=1 Tax=Amaricoccus solimangrovi TaxID=2589815 RepID=A0A501WUZ8_9RHOB|nr:GNAT family N-acetyltransferase [Amaricoccus solimangrovi]TPE52220.1 GNAT family N-acetyltransferase [Amaricoccus solimangrovi]
MSLKAGDSVEVTITHLEMAARPAHPIPHMPAGAPSMLVAAERPPAWYFLQLYDAVGADYEWTDQHQRSTEELAGLLRDPKVTLCTLIRAGWPHGFFVLDARAEGVCDLSYFGLVAEAMGQGLGTFLLCTAVHMAWDQPGTRLVTVNTNTLDHPRALPLYQKVGFQPTRREVVTRILNRDRA